MRKRTQHAQAETVVERLDISVPFPCATPRARIIFVPSHLLYNSTNDNITRQCSKEHRRSSTVRAAVDMSLAVLHWPAFPHWREFRLYLLMKKVNTIDTREDGDEMSFVPRGTKMSLQAGRRGVDYACAWTKPGHLSHARARTSRTGPP